jgi:serine/threonine protein kinase
VPVAEAIDLAGQLLALVGTVHEQDLVLRDLSPGNVMVMPQGRLRLIDLEHAAAIEDRVWTAYTKGYAAPEVLVAPRYGPVPSERADRYSAGVTALYLASGVEPLPVIDPPTGRRLVDLVLQLGRDRPAVRRHGSGVTAAAAALCRRQPRQRSWRLLRQRAELAVRDAATADGCGADSIRRTAPLRKLVHWAGTQPVREPAGGVDRLAPGGRWARRPRASRLGAAMRR